MVGVAAAGVAAVGVAAVGVEVVAVAGVAGVVGVVGVAMTVTTGISSMASALIDKADAVRWNELTFRLDLVSLYLSYNMRRVLLDCSSRCLKSE